MKKTKTAFLIIAIALLVSNIPDVLHRFFNVPVSDFIAGVIKGLGIGIMICVVFHPKFGIRRSAS